MIELVKELVDLGIGAALGGVAIYILSKIITRQFDDAKEDREKNREVQSKVADAIDRLSASHELQERALRETLSALGERHEQIKQAKSNGKR